MIRYNNKFKSSNTKANFIYILKWVFFINFRWHQVLFSNLLADCNILIQSNRYLKYDYTNDSVFSKFRIIHLTPFLSIFDNEIQTKMFAGITKRKIHCKV